MTNSPGVSIAGTVSDGAGPPLANCLTPLIYFLLPNLDGSLFNELENFLSMALLFSVSSSGFASADSLAVTLPYKSLRRSATSATFGKSNEASSPATVAPVILEISPS